MIKYVSQGMRTARHALHKKKSGHVCKSWRRNWVVQFHHILEAVDMYHIYSYIYIYHILPGRCPLFGGWNLSKEGLLKRTRVIWVAGSMVTSNLIWLGYYLCWTYGTVYFQTWGASYTSNNYTYKTTDICCTRSTTYISDTRLKNHI